MIMGDTENVDAQYRTEYSIKALEDAGLKVNKLYEQRAVGSDQGPGECCQRSEPVQQRS